MKNFESNRTRTREYVTKGALALGGGAALLTLNACAEESVPTSNHYGVEALCLQDGAIARDAPKKGDDDAIFFPGSGKQVAELDLNNKRGDHGDDAWEYICYKPEAGIVQSADGSGVDPKYTDWHNGAYDLVDGSRILQAIEEGKLLDGYGNPATQLAIESTKKFAKEIAGKDAWVNWQRTWTVNEEPHDLGGKPFGDTFPLEER